MDFGKQDEKVVRWIRGWGEGEVEVFWHGDLDEDKDEGKPRCGLGYVVGK